MDVLEFFSNTSNTIPSSREDLLMPSRLPNALEIMPVVTDPLDGGWFGKIGTSVVLVFGTFGNLMTIAILRLYHSSWSAMNVYLTALAISDTAMLYSTALPMWARKVIDFDMYITYHVVCKVLIWMTNSSAMASSYTLAALTVQRALSVVWPHRVNVLCTKGKSTAVVVAIAVISGLTWAHVLFGCQIVPINNGTSARCTFGSQQYQEFWINYWVRIDLFLFCVIPLVLLLISNVTLGWKLAVSVKEVQQRFSSSAQEGQKSDRKKKASSVTVTIIIVSAAFILTTFPLMIYNTVYQDLASKDEHSRRLHYFVYDSFLVFVSLNFAWNFYLYCLTGAKFRREFLNILFKCCRCVTSASGANEIKVSATDGNIPRVKKVVELESHCDF